MDASEKLRYEILKFSSCSSKYNLKYFLDNSNHQQQLYSDDMLLNLGLDPIKDEIDIYKHVIEVNDDNLFKKNINLNLYLFDSQSTILEKDFYILYSHGGSIKTNTTLNSLLIPIIFCYLKKLNYNCLIICLDHRGSNNSKQKKLFTLNDRVNDLLIADKFFQNYYLKKIQHQPQFLLMGNSMGGHVCCFALEAIKPNGLILLNPAAYAKKAHYSPFDENFTKVISQKDDWQESVVFNNLHNYLELGGKCLLHVNFSDNIIPLSISQAYVNVTKKFAERGIIYNQSNITHQQVIANDILDLAHFIKEIMKKINDCD